ncbi:MAG: tetratricopeptide repeat protein [Planctomycetota bacterium]
MSDDETTRSLDGHPDRPARRWLRSVPLLVFGVAAALRIAYVLALRGHPQFDAPAMDAGYHMAWANAVAAGEEFQDGPFFRAPLYPLFLALLVAALPEGTLWIRLVQALLGAVTAVLSHRLARRVVGEPAAAVAGLLVAVSWVMIAFDAELLIPVLLVPLLLLALDRAASWSMEDRPRSALFAGVAFGLAAIARPNVLLLMPVLFVWTVVRTRRARAALALTAGTLLPILPVTLHNVLEGDPALIATQGGVNLWIGNNPDSDGASAIVPGTPDSWWGGFYASYEQAEALEGRPLRPSEVSRHYAGRALDWMRSEPADAVAHMAWKARLVVSNVELANNQDIRFTALRTLPLLRASPARWDVLLGFGAVGLFLAARRRREGARLLCAFALVYSASIVLFFVTARFRVPLLPVLAIGAGHAIVEALRALRGGRLAAGFGIVGVASVLAALTNLLPAAVDTTDAAGWANLGRAELDRGNADIAVQHLETAMRLSPGSVQVRVGLASAIAASGGDLERALRLLEEVRGRAGGLMRVELEARILDMRIRTGDAAGALVDVEAALREDPANAELRILRASADVALGRPTMALAALRDLALDEPTNAAVAILVAQLATDLRRPEGEVRAEWVRAASLRRFATPGEAARIDAGLARIDAAQ